MYIMRIGPSLNNCFNRRHEETLEILVNKHDAYTRGGDIVYGVDTSASRSNVGHHCLAVRVRKVS